MPLKRIATFAVMLLCGGALSAQAAVVVTLYNGTTATGNLFGTPGQVVGWGLKIQNQSGSWLLAEMTDYVPGGGSSDIGTYVDVFADPGYAVPIAPGGTVTSYYDPATPGTGLGTYLIDAVSVGASTSGSIVLTYSLFTADPFKDPLAEYVESGLTAAADASITAVPEPSAFGLLAAGLGVVGFARSRKRRQGERGQSAAPVRLAVA